MKKVKILQALGYILFALYLALIIMQLSINLFGKYQDIVFSIVLATVSLNLIYKGVLLKSASTLWFAICLILYAIALVVFVLFHISFESHYYIFAFLPIIASLLNIAIFGNLLYIKVIAINISIIIPITIFRFVTTNIFVVATTAILSIALGIVICRKINIDKENVNG